MTLLDAPRPSKLAQPHQPKKLAWLRAVARYFMWALLIVVVCLGSAATMIPKFAGAESFTVLTSSMEPHLPPGTVVVMKKVAPADVKPGDVITYQMQSGKPEVVTHRVTSKQRNSDGTYKFSTRGDNNPQEDPKRVRGDQVRGVLWYAIPYVGYASVGVAEQVRGYVKPVVIAGLLGYSALMLAKAVHQKRKAKK